MTDYRDVQPGWSLYRLLDAEDRLLYIGCSSEPHVRMYYHESASSPMLDADVIQRHATRCYVTFGSTVRRQALAMEAAAITAERPLLNRQHNYTRWQQVGRQFVPVDEETRRTVELLRGSEPTRPDAVADEHRRLQQERMELALSGFADLRSSA